MKIHKKFTTYSSYCGLKSTLTLGTFDGVHIGHRHILKQVILRAHQSGEKAVVLTFDRHPGTVLNQKYSPKLLTTLDEKLAIFDEIGIDITFVITFTKSISEMTAEQFIKEYLIDCLGMSHFIVGFDHGFGKGRNGSSENLKSLAQKYNFILEIQKPIIINGMIVKSTTVRELIIKGKFELASQLLGAEYSLRGCVIPGHGVGKKIGVPTANITVKDSEIIIPSSGVYAGWLESDGQKRDAILCIGSRPTFGGEEETIEAHIPEFEGDLYGKGVRVGFVKRLRDIVKFKSSQELVQQIKKDIEVLKQHILI